MKIGRNTVVLLLFFAFHFQSSGQNCLLCPDDFPDIKLTRSDVFNGEGLWGYIDGGADIYLEYGFEKVHVLEVEKDGNKYKIDIYSMNSPQAAFGIFSIHLFNAEYVDSLTYGYSITPYQIQMHYGKYYISIVLSKKGGENLRFAEKLKILLMSRLSFQPFFTPAIFLSRDFQSFRSTLKFIAGPLGIQNHLSEWEMYFEGMNSFSIYYITRKSEKGDGIIADIQFGNKEEKLKFLLNMKAPADLGAEYETKTEDKRLLILNRGELEILFVEAQL